MIGKLLGHTQTQTTARYAHLATDPALEAASKITDELGGLLALPPPSDPMIIDVEAVPVDAPASAPLAGLLCIENTNDLPRFMTSEQAAKYLSVNPRLMDHWRWRKTGPKHVKVGNSVRYTRADLDDFVENGSANTAREESMVNPIVKNAIISAQIP